jgi:SLA1 homology domain 1, SHD1
MRRLRYPVLALLLLNAFALGDEAAIDYDHRWQGQRRRRELATPAPATVAFGGVFFLEVANYAQVVLAKPDKQFVKRLEEALTETATDDSRHRQRFAHGQIHIDINATTERSYNWYEFRVKLSALQVRTWTDSTGQFYQKAGYIDHDKENVRLISDERRETAVSIVKLSVKDREWLNDTERTMSFIVQPTHTTLFE